MLFLIGISSVVSISVFYFLFFFFFFFFFFSPLRPFWSDWLSVNFYAFLLSPFSGFDEAEVVAAGNGFIPYAPLKNVFIFCKSYSIFSLTCEYFYLSIFSHSFSLMRYKAKLALESMTLEWAPY